MSCVKTDGDNIAAEKAVKVQAEHEEEDDDEEQGPDGEEQGAVDAKKKKKKRNKKKKPAAAAAVNGLANGQTAGDAPKEATSTSVKSPAAGAVVKPAAEVRGLASQGSSEFPLPKEQSYPPRKPVHEIFTNGKYPIGVWGWKLIKLWEFLCTQSINQSINQPIDQSIYLENEPTINQSINQAISNWAIW